MYILKHNVTFHIHAHLVHAVHPAPKTKTLIDLVLDGEADALTLLSIQLNGKDLVEGTDYTLKGDELTIPASVLGDAASKLTTRVEIVPETNTQLSGLYKSGSMYCTQCEAMG